MCIAVSSFDLQTEHSGIVTFFKKNQSFEQRLTFQTK